MECVGFIHGVTEIRRPMAPATRGGVACVGWVLRHDSPQGGARLAVRLAGRLRQAGAQFVSSGVVTIPSEAQAKFGFKKALMIRDPNGHALRLVEE